MLDLTRQSQGTQEVGEIVGQRMELKPHGIMLERPAGKPGPADGRQRRRTTRLRQEPSPTNHKPHMKLRSTASTHAPSYPDFLNSLGQEQTPFRGEARVVFRAAEEPQRKHTEVRIPSAPGIFIRRG
jgi:hypothetical protein